MPRKRRNVVLAHQHHPSPSVASRWRAGYHHSTLRRQSGFGQRVDRPRWRGSARPQQTDRSRKRRRKPRPTGPRGTRFGIEPRTASSEIARCRRDGKLSLLRHHHEPYMVDPGRISGTELLYPFKYVGIQAHGHQLLWDAFNCPSCFSESAGISE